MNRTPKTEDSRPKPKPVEDPIKKLTELVRVTRNLVTALAAITGIMFVLLVGMQVQLGKQGDSLDTLQTTADDAKSAATTASDSLADAIENSQQSNVDVAAAVQTIFYIYAVVCEQFPDASPCASDG